MCYIIISLVQREADSLLNVMIFIAFYEFACFNLVSHHQH